jgi:hypothetical protein
MTEDRFPTETGIFFFVTTWRQALASTSHPTGTRLVKRLQREADHSIPSSARVKNEWRYTSTSPYILRWLRTRTTLLLWDFRFSRRQVRHMNVFLDVAPCSLVEVCRWVIALMMEAASTSETSVNFYQTTRRYKPEDSNLQRNLVHIFIPHLFNILP